MKNKILYITVFSLSLLAIYTCKKEETTMSPSVVTASVDSISFTSARVGGNVSADGGAKVSERGVYWGTLAGADTTGVKLQIGSGTGTFFYTLTGLTSGVKYYVKSYATNSNGTSYGDETFFTTQISSPTVTTAEISDYTSFTAKVGGTVSDDGGNSVTQRGVYWGLYTNPKLTGTKLVIGSGKGVFSQTISGLNRAISYYVVAFATNIKGTSYGAEIRFTTTPELPTISTYAASSITSSSAKLGGEITSSGGATITERGIYWGNIPNTQTTGTKVAIGTGTGTFSSTIESLSPGTTYFFTTYAINSIGTSYGVEKSFTMLGKIPEATTLEAADITPTTATLSGMINANDLSTEVTLEYGTTTDYGNSVIASGSPTIEDDDTLSASITGLTKSTTYHFRVKAVNALGTAYGADSTFTTVVTGLTGTVADFEGNIYSTIGINNLYWMAENLQSTKYFDGSNIPKVKEDTSWVKLSTPAYCWYNNDSLLYHDTYGALYNWYTVNTHKLCPSGWRLPTNDEITELNDYLGSDAGKLLKETGTSHWNTPNTGATNQYGFTARPGGSRASNGSYDLMGVEGDWWTYSDYSTLTASYFYMLYNQGNSFQANGYKKNGLSVRCVKKD